jgi:catechol 2,3-dioxygenase-like lactoylglutathione lyase family enzyme
MQNTPQLTINGIQHIGIPVTHIQSSQAFYERLGFANVMQATFDEKGEPGTCVIMQRAQMIIELYQLPESGLGKIRSRQNGHIDHVVFDVPDIDVAFAALKDAGFNILEPEPKFLQFWAKGCKFFNITGPDGERLEFNQVL